MDIFKVRGEMPHKCIKCGREFRDGSTEILKGCPSCSGKKFVYVREEERHAEVLEEKPLAALVEGREGRLLEVQRPVQKEIELHERVETIRILGPGRYEVNIEKLAESDEMVLGLGKEGRYIVDIHSMARVEKEAKKEKKRRKEKSAG